MGYEICSTCDGSGVVVNEAGDDTENCGTCSGEGLVDGGNDASSEDED